MISIRRTGDGFRSGLFKEGIDIVNRLGKILTEAGRTDEFLASLNNEELQKKLLAEFGLLDEKE